MGKEKRLMVLMYINHQLIMEFILKILLKRIATLTITPSILSLILSTTTNSTMII